MQKKISNFTILLSIYIVKEHTDRQRAAVFVSAASNTTTTTDNDITVSSYSYL